MTFFGLVQIIFFSLAILAITKPMGVYIFNVMETHQKPLMSVIEPIKGLSEKLSGIDPKQEQTWVEYALSVMYFSIITCVMTYVILRLQDILPLNPQKLPGIPSALAFNTSSSFTTNTNWQAYSGESTMSYFSQMVALAWHNFLSAATGIAVAIACARGFTRKIPKDAPKTIGNFWADLMNILLYVLIPLSIVGALLLVSEGVIQNFSPYPEIRTMENATQTIPLGPVASQEAIKQLGTNGGGFFNANAAHPYESPTPFTNFLSMFFIFAIPAGLTYTYGLMTKNTKQGWVLFLAMSILFGVGLGTVYWAESKPNPVLNSLPLNQTAGNLEGKEMRFGVANSALYSVVTTDASCGAVNCMHDSFSPLGGMIPLLNIMLGEVIFGGVGSGLYGMLIFVMLSVFIAGLMVGRTPEYLGKKIEAKEMKLVTLYILIFPILILLPSAWSAVTDHGLSSLNNGGPHGLSEILYAFTSASGNNGSAFAGLNANTDWFNYSLGFCMLFGRFWMMLPVLALAGSMAGKKTVPESLGTFPTDNLTFVALLVSIMLIVGALTFFPALSLGPIVEHFLLLKGKVF
ncbi:MAG: potassium-transporting ATPase subunit KdpA [Candidatus Riflebacteria bacterium]|nr:potassium-transporting ATPase subunit KdpA [Candidatus Riflebacteria bacterium]